ncbi:hypothetical protein FBUS_10456 [Fasciolopsis buskii]|uniref:Nucleoporin Nup133/Nup155-like N-terminal domain-containing protein n=1 Tax=Fasciolopsis buskii TaxID=27845 RepID=A0A8E0RU16_9TREM|nr:hypothetical protein FBUS_10456 [Fasciolopsis buski]
MERVHSSLPVFAMESLKISKSKQDSSVEYHNSDSSVRFHPGGWVAIVAGNELFLWKYLTTSQTQPRSACLRFSLPSSDLPHTARLVCLLLPPSGPDTAITSLFPAGCLALSPCGQSLRLWPQLTRNYAHADVTPSALVNGLYGDEAIQMESTSMVSSFHAIGQCKA